MAGGDYLGAENLLTRQFYSFNECRNIVMNHKLKSADQYKQFRESTKLDKSLPTNPHSAYKKKGWKNWYHFFGRDD